MNIVKKIVAWSLTVFFALSAIAFCPSIFSLFALLFVALIIPIAKWQEIIRKFISSKVKGIIAVVLVIISIFSVPSNKSNTKAGADSNITAASTPISSPSAVVDTTTDTVPSVPTIAPAHTPNTVPSTPSTEPATTPTAAPSSPSITPTPPSAELPHTHSFSAATCTVPKTCSCGATEGSANGHNWKDATCTSPKVCATCNETSGSAIKHNYSNGKCTVCGGKDPNYVSETLVWIPTHGGEKYHSKSGCSKMIDPIQVTKSEAISQGYGPCGRCY